MTKATLEHSFNLRNPVIIKPISAEGVVIAVHLSLDGLQYFVRYFMDGKVIEAYFFGHELEIDKKRFIDFYGEEEVRKSND
jgi:hypothetical protein